MCLGLLLEPAWGQSADRTDYRSVPNREARQWLEKAYLAYDREAYPEALRALDQAVMVQHDLVDAYVLRAQTREHLNDLGGAITDYSIILHLSPAYSEALLGRALALYHQARYEEAIADLTTLLHVPPGETNAVLFSGSYAADGSFEATGLTTVQSGMQADYLNYIGLARMKLEQYDSARARFSEAIALQSSRPDYWVNRGLAHLALTDTARGVSDFAAAVALDADHAGALRNLSLLRYTSAGAAKAYARALEEGQSEETLLQRGMQHQADGDFQAALAAYDQALRLNPRSVDLHMQRAFTLEKLERSDEALRAYERALALQAKPEAYLNRGNIYFRQKDYTAALREYDRALNMDPLNPKAFYNRGLTRHYLRRNQEACEDLLRAKQLGMEVAAKPLEVWCNRP
ncbi:Tetratricopeptide repeat-containing protein [Catalinimonas alkaloidigena]|uniref:Tetratricopeptide repeat-containing protein n=1 Tax=Catalinimonas alkaloidigena TaxID=1075417 RepID=A0A1G9J5Q5_9BACT|nr:tetratricopeptide repeat protein [Catalinimonas alkaloidigena]SDL32565.1 Tetratricopeptide repeat-containing protein [Catalinimonas alkaloidigena]